MATAKKKPLAAPTKQPLKQPLKPPTQARRTPAKGAAPEPKTAPKPTPAPVQPAKASKKKEKPEKVKVVRDSFTIPKAEYAQIAEMKQRAMALGLEVKKSELIRAGLALLQSTSDAAFRKALGNVPTLKTGRPGKA